MTKKKLVALILACSFILYCCGMVVNYMVALNDIANDVHQYFGSAYNQNMLIDYVNGEIPDIETLQRNIQGYSPDVAISIKPAYAYVLLDKDGNVLFRSESGVFWSEQDERGEYQFKYASIEKYMTPEVKAEIMKIKRQAPDGKILITEIGLNSSSGADIPVSITFSNQKGGYSKILLNNLTVERFIGKGVGFSWNLYDINEKSIDHIYYERVKAKLEKAISEYHYDGDDGGGGTCSTGEMELNDIIDGYGFYLFAEYNPFYETVTSDYFFALTLYTAFFFIVATAVILAIANKLYNKNQNLNRNRQAFISAAAHELKTPIAVIQNNCECIIEGINPDKDEVYIKTVYNEALRMNDIVKTLLLFNRLGNAEAVVKEKCSLSEIVLAETEKYLSFAQAKGIEVLVEYDENIFVNCNRELITFAVDNYLSNAIKYSGNKNPVKVFLKKEKNIFKFTVYNDCNKILLSDEIWDVFSKGDASRHSDGSSTGMGLPICKRIFGLHSFNYGYNLAGNGVIFYFKGKALK